MADRYQHRKGGTYSIIALTAKIQTDTPLKDYDQVTVYRSEQDDSVWVRPVSEFVDGRFTLIPGRTRFVCVQENKMAGKIATVISQQDGMVTFTWPGSTVPHHLGRGEFEKRFRPEEEANPSPVTHLVGSVEPTKRQIEAAIEAYENGSYLNDEQVLVSVIAIVRAAFNAPSPETNLHVVSDDAAAIGQMWATMHEGEPVAEIVAAAVQAERDLHSQPPSPRGRGDDEKLALCIKSLKRISGDPARDAEVEQISGQHPTSWASVREARRTLSMIGVSLTSDSEAGRGSPS